jgi:single-strand DNA-binding protein
MAGRVNKVTLVANLGRGPEVRTTQDGQKIVNLSVATNETWTDRRSGERKERVEWHRIVIFNDHHGDVAEKTRERVGKSLSRAHCEHANGPVRVAETVIQPKS